MYSFADSTNLGQLSWQYLLERCLLSENTGGATLPGAKCPPEVGGVLVTEGGGYRLHALICFQQVLARPVPEYLAPDCPEGRVFPLQSSIQGSL